MKPPRSRPLALLFLAVAATSAHSQIPLVIDPPPASLVLDDFNDGVDTTAALVNASSAGEAGGVVEINVPASASDPQFQFPNASDAFNISKYPHFRIRGNGSVAAASQAFPLPAAAGTVLGFNVNANYTEDALTFSTDTPLADGSGIRIDPLATGPATESTFGYDYLILDKFPTVGVAEFDRDGDMSGFNIAGNGHIIDNSVTSSTSSFNGTTAGNDPVFSRSGLSVDTAIYDVLEIRAAFDPASISRLEIFWGTSTNAGPAAGQSVVVTSDLIRDGQFHTYRFLMSDDARWDGTLNLLRIDPLADADAADGRTFAFDYVRVLSGAPVVDSDKDGLPDAVETNDDNFVDEDATGSDPNDPDSDGDLFDDGVEVRAGTDPNDDMEKPGGTLDGYGVSPAVYGIGAPILPNTPVTSVEAPTGFSVTPALPDGLALDPTTGSITGEPTVVTSAADYTITASFNAGPDSSFDLNIEVTNPGITGYSQNPASYTRGADAGANSPILTGVVPDLFSVAPPLPDGLAIDQNTGVITGTPTVVQAATSYTVTASYTGFPDAMFSLSIAVEPGPLLVVDPAQTLTSFTPLGEFNNDGDVELWGSNNAGIAAAGGFLVVNTTAGDPQVFKNALGLDTADGEHSVLEFRLRQPDTVSVELFWADTSGGLSPLRSFTITPANIPGDGDFHIYQIDLAGIFVGTVGTIRLDPGPGPGRTVEFDYIRLGKLTAPEPPRFTGISYDSELDEATVTWTSTEGETFSIDASNDGSNWFNLNDNWPAAAGQGTTSYLDTSAAASPVRIYRVSRVSP